MSGIEGYPGFISDIVQGSTRDFVITMKRLLNGVKTPIDLTGAKFYITFAYDNDKDTAPEFTVTIDPPTDPLNGITTGSIPASDTLVLQPGKIYYSVRYISSAGKPYVIDMAKISIIPAISDQVT